MKEQKEIAVFSFTRTANRLNRRVQEALSGCGCICEGYTAKRLKGTEDLLTLDEDIGTWIGRYWGKKTFLFIGAAGIAVRYIAPWIQDKYTDSAVLVMDERGEYVIPLLSGHMGGAVAVAREIEKALDVTAVITTATDVQDKFAVDVFVRDNGLRISDRHLVKRISSAVLEEEPVGFYSELPAADALPAGLVRCGSMDELAKYAYGIAVVTGETAGNQETQRVLVLSPVKRHRIVAGIGCRRGTQKRRIKAALSGLLEEHGLSLDDVVKLASIDLKKDEQGILELAKECHIPFYTYSAAELETVQIKTAGSDFVREVTGVDNVCERAARRCAPDGKLLQPKRIADGITFAIVEEQTVLTFKERGRWK